MNFYSFIVEFLFSISFDFNSCSNLVYFDLIQVNFDVKFQKKIKKNGENSSKARQGSKTREQSTAIQGAKISHDGIQHAKIHFKVRISKTSISHTSRPFSHRANQCAKISHTTVQGAKFIPVCETRWNSLNVNFAHHYSRCENFYTVRIKVRNFRTVQN